MKCRPITLNGEMVRAIIMEQKTQVRQMIDPQSAVLTYELAGGLGARPLPIQSQPAIECPFGEVGDRLWVQENFSITDDGEVIYQATDPFNFNDPMQSASHMPRFASRILLEVTGARSERLQDISEEDAQAEGMIYGGCLNCGESEPCECDNPQPDARDAFAELWQFTAGEESWHANPMVWVIEFKRLHLPVPMQPSN